LVYDYLSFFLVKGSASDSQKCDGLNKKDAQEILRRDGPNRAQSKERITPLGLFI
jgi:hypothetical protein